MQINQLPRFQFGQEWGRKTEIVHRGASSAQHSSTFTFLDSTDFSISILEKDLDRMVACYSSGG